MDSRGSALDSPFAIYKWCVNVRRSCNCSYIVLFFSCTSQWLGLSPSWVYCRRCGILPLPQSVYTVNSAFATIDYSFVWQFWFRTVDFSVLCASMMAFTAFTDPLVGSSWVLYFVNAFHCNDHLNSWYCCFCAFGLRWILYIDIDDFYIAFWNPYIQW